MNHRSKTPLPRQPRRRTEGIEQHPEAISRQTSGHSAAVDRWKDGAGEAKQSNQPEMPMNTQQPASPQPCAKCAYTYTPFGVRRDDHGIYAWCAHGARRDVVTGYPEHEGLVKCYDKRSRRGECGPEGRLFATALSAADFNRLFNPADLAVDGHGLDESGEQNRIFGGVPVSENSINLGDCNLEVGGDIGPGVPSTLING